MSVKERGRKLSKFRFGMIDRRSFTLHFYGDRDMNRYGLRLDQRTESGSMASSLVLGEELIRLWTVI